MRPAHYLVLIAAAVGCESPPQLTQPRETSSNLTTPQYTITKLTSSLGGTVSRGTAINSGGLVAGFSNLAGNLTRHAALFRDGSIVNLGTLGGVNCPECNSSVVWPGINNQGLVVGISETVDLDPLQEAWSCTAFFPSLTGHICRGFVWQAGQMTPLPTFGGNQGFATGVNGRGQVVGWAETPVHDPTCNAPQVLQFRAGLWETKDGTMKQLPPFPGDSTSAATAINEAGQAVGISGDCDVAVGRFSARHAVIWDHGTVTDIGNLGGTSWHTPMAISKKGDIVGFSNPPGDAGGAFIAHAFLWTKQQGIQDLGTLPGDFTSQALSINSRGQVVGFSTSATGVNRAFLWQKGKLTKLNDLVEPGFADSLVSAQDINEAGQITGRVFERSSGKTLAFVATPIQ
jgi:probable HAF family extracellular repeat protein